jgi:DNA polymerase III delta prime subunit
MDIKATLINKALKDQLGHFYILKTSKTTESKEFLMNWVLDFCVKYVNEVNGNFRIDNILNHEDILVIERDVKETGNYKLADFSQMFAFLNYAATRHDRKLIIIDDAHKLSTNVANKLLKTLEEPPVNCTIFLLNSTNTALMDTINSRGIKIRIKSDKVLNEENLFDILISRIKNGIDTDEFINEFKFDKEKEQRLLLDFNSWCLFNNIKAEILWDLEQVNKQYQEDLIYHAAPLHRLNKLLNIMRKTIL